MYLGEFEIDINLTEFKNYAKADWAFYFIDRYGGFDGSHHKDWVLDQCARILKGTSVNVKIAKWDNGQSEYRVSTGEPSEDYKKWVKSIEEEYGYDSGIAP